MRKEPPARPRSAPPLERKTPPGGAGERPPQVQRIWHCPRPPILYGVSGSFPERKPRLPCHRERCQGAPPGEPPRESAGIMAPWALVKGRSAAPAARRLTPHPRPVPCARSTPPPSPRSAWRAISPHSGHSSARVSTAAGELQVSLSPGLAARPYPATSPRTRKREHPGRPRESGRLERPLCL